jgi:Ca2+-binding EF-hand superfamily protein
MIRVKWAYKSKNFDKLIRIPMKNLNAFITLILLTPLMGMAQTPTPSDAGKTNAATRSFVVIDKNKDGHISREEAQQAGVSTLNFDAADKDKDGKLNLSEWTLIKF